jgi:hypothetical protein
VCDSSDLDLVPGHVGVLVDFRELGEDAVEEAFLVEQVPPGLRIPVVPDLDAELLEAVSDYPEQKRRFLVVEQKLHLDLPTMDVKTDHATVSTQQYGFERFVGREQRSCSSVDRYPKIERKAVSRVGDRNA